MDDNVLSLGEFKARKNEHLFWNLKEFMAHFLNIKHSIKECKQACDVLLKDEDRLLHAELDKLFYAFSVEAEELALYLRKDHSEVFDD